MNSNVDTSKIKNNKYDRLNLLDICIDAYASSIQYYSRLNSAFMDALFVPFTDAREEITEIKNEVKETIFFDYQQQQEFYKEVEKILFSKIHSKFNKNFSEKSFVNSLSEFVESLSNLAKISGFGLMYQQLSNLNSFWNNTFIEPIRDTIYRTPSHKIHSENKYSLFHYDLPQDDRQDNNGRRDSKSNERIEEKGILEIEKTKTEDFDISSNTNTSTSFSSTPLLIIYAFINRSYILDILPDSSIVRNLQRQGFDIYATDWGTPSAYDKELTLGHYVNNYLANAIDYIIEHSNSDKVSLLGYCWGGDLALMLAALHPEKVKNLVTFATPGDFSIDNNLLSVWARSINADSIVDAFGNVPSVFINSAFLLRSPIDFMHKYPHFFLEGRLQNIDSIMEFVATEMWLNDSPPVIGEIYRQFINECYHNNLLIKNQMIIGANNKIDLSKIKHPFLNVIASRDDLVAPASSRVLNDAIGSSDKSIIEFNFGHVGACISSRAHKELWPSVGNWLKER